jgi:hypothetical protein
VRERIEYRFRVSSAAVFTLYSYSKTLEYHLEYATADSLSGSTRSGEFARQRSIPCDRNAGVPPRSLLCSILIGTGSILTSFKRLSLTLTSSKRLSLTCEATVRL